MSAGLVSAFPIYLNGLISLLWAFTMPGLILVRMLDSSCLSERLLVVVLSSLTVNHLLVVLIASLHLDPLVIYRWSAFVMLAAFGYLIFARMLRRNSSLHTTAVQVND